MQTNEQTWSVGQRLAGFVVTLAISVTAATLVYAEAGRPGRPSPQSLRPPVFSPTPDFFDIADRSDGKAVAVVAAASGPNVVTCIAGCVRPAALGQLELKVQSYEVLTSAHPARAEPVVFQPVRVALSTNVSCLAGCGAPLAATATAQAAFRVYQRTAQPSVFAATQTKPRAISRFALSSMRAARTLGYTGHKVSRVAKSHTQRIARL
jgi:hypothetical protein